MIVEGIPIFCKQNKVAYGDCKIGKPTRVPHSQIKYITTTQVLELMHIDLFVPTQTESTEGKKYALVCVDFTQDLRSLYSRSTWIYFLRNKFDTFSVFRRICLTIK